MSARHARRDEQATRPWGKLAACTASTALLAAGMAAVSMPPAAIAVTVGLPAAAVGCCWYALRTRQERR